MKTRLHSSTVTLSAWCLIGLTCLCIATRAHAQSTGETRALVNLGVGPAIGTRSIELPARQGTLQLDTGVHPGLELTLQLGVQRGRWSLSASADYRSSLLLRTESSFLSGEQTGRAALRSHSLHAGLVPGYRFVAAGLSMRATLFVGFAVRALRTVAQLAVPSYSLHGLALRPQLHVALVEELLSVRAGPELGVIVHESRDLREMLGGVPPAITVGAVLAFELRVSEGMHVVLGYQLAYATQSSTWHKRFVDVEHYVHTRFELRY